MESLNQSEGMKVFNKYESEVRSYVRSFPTVFTKAKGCKLWDVDGKEYIDFLSGAGALNYGHNPDGMKEKLIEYIQNDGVAHSLDMATTAKEQFLKRFNEVILEPRSMDYKIMFPGPTGTNTVESALKLARKVTGRSNIISFTNGFHGMTIGALSVTGNSFKRQGAGIPLTNTTSMPFDNFMNNDFDTVEYLEQHLDNQGSGMDKPAAIILETVQGEGGINAARFEWMKQIEQVCRKHDILLIIDDVQAGCGRTGTFFSFEPAGIEPDIICLSKSIGGYGQPFAITLFKPKYDIWKPGEHNGTFRGNNFAFIAATEAMTYWEDNSFIEGITKRADKVSAFLEKLVKEYPELKGEHRGRGLMQGIAVGEDGLADKICEAAFEHGLIMETSGPDSEVFKLFPPLNVDMKDLEKGLSIIEEAIKATVKEPVNA